MLKIPAPTDLVRCMVALSLVVAAACSSGGNPSGVQAEEPLDPGEAGAKPSGGDSGAGAPSGNGGNASPPEPVGSGSMGSVGEEPAEEPTPDRGEGGGPSDEPRAEGGSGGAAEEPEEPGEPSLPSEAFLRGQELAAKNGCATCHQADFGGFTVFPNITPDSKTGIGDWTNEQIIAAIRDGRDVDGSALCATMQRYAFSDEQMSDVIAFLRGLPPVARRITSTCPGHGE
jgi:Cytochrome c